MVKLNTKRRRITERMKRSNLFRFMITNRINNTTPNMPEIIEIDNKLRTSLRSGITGKLKNVTVNIAINIPVIV